MRDVDSVIHDFASSKYWVIEYTVRMDIKKSFRIKVSNQGMFKKFTLDKIDDVYHFGFDWGSRNGGPTSGYYRVAINTTQTIQTTALMGKKFNIAGDIRREYVDGDELSSMTITREQMHAIFKVIEDHLDMTIEEFTQDNFRYLDASENFVSSGMFWS